MMAIRKWPKTESEDVGFVRKYCLAKTYPASDLCCPYVKAKITAKSSKISTGRPDFIEVDGIFLCRYPDESIPLQEAYLTSGLDRCPNTERREVIDTLYRLENGQPILRRKRE